MILPMMDWNILSVEATSFVISTRPSVRKSFFGNTVLERYGLFAQPPFLGNPPLMR